MNLNEERNTAGNN